MKTMCYRLAQNLFISFTPSAQIFLGGGGTSGVGPSRIGLALRSCWFASLENATGSASVLHFRFHLITRQNASMTLLIYKQHTEGASLYDITVLPLYCYGAMTQVPVLNEEFVNKLLKSVLLLINELTVLLRYG